jgi:hypothetical protein
MLTRAEAVFAGRAYAAYKSIDIFTLYPRWFGLPGWKKRPLH